MKLKADIICALTLFVSLGAGGALPKTRISDCQSSLCDLRENVSQLEKEKEVLKTEIRYINKAIDDRTFWTVGTFVFFVGFLGLGTIQGIRQIVMKKVKEEVKYQGDNVTKEFKENMDKEFKKHRENMNKVIKEHELKVFATLAIEKFKEGNRREKEAKSYKDIQKRIDDLEKYGPDADK